MKKHYAYCGGGWFSDRQVKTLDSMEEILKRYFSVHCPREIKCNKEELTFDSSDKILKINCDEIEKANVVFISTEDKDLGSIWEFGYSYAKNKPIVCVNYSLPDDAKFNVMLASSCIAIARNEVQLIDICDIIEKTGIKSFDLLKYKQQFKPE